MNWLDVLLLLPLLVGLVRVLMRGFISEVIAIVVVILGVIGARFGAPPFSEWMLQQFAWPQGVCDVVSYTLVFLAVAILLSLIAKGLTRFLKAVNLGWMNRLAGGLFGIAKYGLLVLVAVFVLNRANESFHFLDDAPVVKTSVVYQPMVKITDYLILNTEVVR